MTPAQQIRGLYQVGFTAQQLTDFYENCNDVTFNLTCVQDLLDADIQITSAGALAALGGNLGSALLALYGGSWAQYFESAISITGDMIRQACPQTNYATASVKNPQGLPYPICRDLCQQFLYAKNLTLILIDLGATVKKLYGTKSGLSDFLYFPLFSVISYIGGYFVATDVLLLQGAGVVTGGIIPDGNVASTGIENISALTSQGPPVGQPSFFGDFNIGARYDALDVSTLPTSAPLDSYPAGTKGLRLAGVPFTNIPVNDPRKPNEGVFFGSVQSPDGALLQDANGKLNGHILCIPPPGFTKDYLTFRASNGNLFTTRTPITIQ
jgi:hypothetical protein